MACIQWNLRIKDTLGAELLSSFRRLSSGGRFIQIQITIYSYIKELYIDSMFKYCSFIVCMNTLYF